jgi:4-diphosphocytidyl-2-C-methyl-D-erythritol kinase
VQALSVFSPAKINLYLEVLARRSDGYHDIESVMQVVDLCDQVHLERAAAGISLTVAGGDAPADATNLAYRAAALLRQRVGLRDGVRIHLEKRIPVGGGLGGGSGNAAAVLAGLNRLFDLGQSPESLARFGADLGSDVPFFLSPGLALVTGRGEQVRPLASWPPGWMVVANPGVSISTAWAYREVSSKLTERETRSTIQTLVTAGPLPWPPTWAFNRFEEAVLPQRPEIRRLRQLLEAGGAAPALMTGSGASVFGVVADAASAQELARRARATGAFAAAVTTLPRNPILADPGGG